MGRKPAMSMERSPSNSTSQSWIVIVPRSSRLEPWLVEFFDNKTLKSFEIKKKTISTAYLSTIYQISLSQYIALAISCRDVHSEIWLYTIHFNPKYPHIDQCHLKFHLWLVLVHVRVNKHDLWMFNDWFEGFSFSKKFHIAMFTVLSLLLSLMLYITLR